MQWHRFEREKSGGAGGEEGGGDGKVEAAAAASPPKRAKTGGAAASALTSGMHYAGTDAADGFGFADEELNSGSSLRSLKRTSFAKTLLLQ